MNTQNYERLAEIYDNIMFSVEYNLWFDLIVKICKENFRGQQVKVLEIGGGTGILGKKLEDYGFEYLGSDISPAMAKIARDKKLDFICADCRNLPIAANFDLALFLFDGINYLFDIVEFTQTFAQVHSVLKDGGLFLFDITTKTNSMKNFYNYRESHAEENYAYIRESYFDEESREQHNDFEIFIKGKGRGENYRRFTERHCQKVHSVKNVINSIPLNLFEVAGIWGGFNRKKWNKESERVHFLLRKK